jgi:hypothetical protein
MIRRRSVLAALGGAAACAPVIAATPPAAESAYDEPADVFRAMANQPRLTLPVGDRTIDVIFADGAPGVDRARVIAWIRKSALAVATYFGVFPVRHVGLLVVGQDGDRVGHGTTYGFHGSAIRIRVGRSADDAAFARDWILVHEMTHLALPRVPRRSLWLQEGNATYVEPIARAQAGQLEPATVWKWSIEGMPKGEPGPDDQGLDRTPTWGRTYWGGAMFWLVADIAIHRRTNGRHSLQEALRAINRASGGNTADWSSGKVMAAGDAPTGTDVLQALYDSWKETPVTVDLAATFKDLGVAEADGRVVFDEDAPLADFRRQLTRRS